MQGQQDVSSFIETFTGSHHFILDYLIEEVLLQQEESTQSFLLQTAILDRLTGTLCNTLTGDSTGQETLETLAHANLFIVPLDEERRWYRYHHLFSDLLRQRLRQTQPDLRLALHTRASQWYAQNGFADEAIEHGLRAENFEQMAQLIESHFDAFYRRGEHSRLRRWLAALPIDLVLSKPQLSILHAWGLFSSGQLDAAEVSLQAAQDILTGRSAQAPETPSPAEDQLPDGDRNKLLGEAAAIRAFIASYRGDVPGTIQHASRALANLPQQELNWRAAAAIALGDAYAAKGDVATAYQARLNALEISNATDDEYLKLIANLKVAATLRRHGQLRQVIEICRRQLRLAEESGLSGTVVAGWLLAIWGETLAELNDLDEAIKKARQGLELVERGKDVAMLGWSTLCLVRILYSRGNMSGAEEIIRKIEAAARKQDMPPWITNTMSAWQGRIWLVQGKLDAVSWWVEDRGLKADGDVTYLRQSETMTLARFHLARGHWDETHQLLQRLLAAVEAGEHITRVIEVLILQALAFQAEQKPEQAMTSLDRALTLAEPRGFIQIFVDEGPPMAQLLSDAGARKISPIYVRQLLAAYPVAKIGSSTSPKAPTPSSELVEPLSERELEVLELIAMGLTNPEIASRLFLSLNTVKVHTRNIYGKLGAHNRTEAVTKARAIGILRSA